MWSISHKEVQVAKLTSEIIVWAEEYAPITYGNYIRAYSSGDKKRTQRLIKTLKQKYKEVMK